MNVLAQCRRVDVFMYLLTQEIVALHKTTSEIMTLFPDQRPLYNQLYEK